MEKLTQNENGIKFSTYIIVWDDGDGCNSITNSKLDFLETDKREWWSGLVGEVTQGGYAIDGFTIDEEDEAEFLKKLKVLRHLYKFRVFAEIKLKPFDIDFD